MAQQSCYQIKGCCCTKETAWKHVPLRQLHNEIMSGSKAILGATLLFLLLSRWRFSKDSQGLRAVLRRLASRKDGNADPQTLLMTLP
ncbi:hypothetical protein ABBQ32_013192 [Trebouxia sp. C0010 RCD-2024]